MLEKSVHYNKHGGYDNIGEDVIVINHNMNQNAGSLSDSKNISCSASQEGFHIKSC